MSVAGLVVLLLVRQVFMNTKNLVSMSRNTNGKSLSYRSIPVVISVILAEFCFVIVFVAIGINPLYSFILTVIVLTLLLAGTTFNKSRG